MNFYGKLPQFKAVVLVSDRNEAGLIAIVVLADAEIPAEIAESDPADTALNARGGAHLPEAACDAFLTIMQDAARQAGKKVHEIPVGIVVETKPWTEHEVTDTGETGLITLTGKPKRAVIKDVYRAEWMQQYSRARPPTIIARTGSDADATLPRDVAVEYETILFPKARELLEMLAEVEASENGVLYAGINKDQETMCVPNRSLVCHAPPSAAPCYATLLGCTVLSLPPAPFCTVRLRGARL